MAEIKDPNKYFSRLPVKVERAIREDIPKVVANKLAHAFRENFQTESFFGQKWQDVKRRAEADESEEGKADARRKILTGRSGNLGRSLQTEVKDGECSVISDLPYSAAHNEGTTTAGRGNHTTIPQRQFIGDHPAVQKIIEETIVKHIAKLLNHD